MSRWLALIPLAALVAAAVLFAGWSLWRDPTAGPEGRVGRPLPASTLPALADDRPVDLTQAAQGPVVINLFASWCTPCRVEHPELQALSDQGVRIIGVAYKDQPADARAFLAELGDPYSLVVQDREGRFGLDIGVTGVPETLVVDASGRVVFRHAGPLVGTDGEAALTRIRALTLR